MSKRKKFHKQATKAISEEDELASIRKQIEVMPSDDSVYSKFTDFPLCSRTKKGLRSVGYAVPTDIQKASLRLGLQGKDILGASKTGSGKTLAFLIPVLELLWRERWSTTDGVGALIISPTRELAYQIFQVLRKVGSFHDSMNAGMVTGGMNFSEESKRIATTNIIVCTPGRLLQHMDETPNFHCDNLQVLVLDEADRILDMGFAATVNALVANLPPQRQTMLFSATQTKSVRQLARLSLQNPEYVAVDDAAQFSTPKQLTQSYMEVNVEDKMKVLYSFIRSNTSSKAIVFMSCCKQVKFVYECFRRLRPGVPLLALHGKLKQTKRTGIYNDFRKKQNAFLFATDIAARGLDFPAVNWVVMMDCPEDADTYIHRAGRTARFEKDGQSLLMLTPSEKEGMLKALEQRKVPINEVKADPRKVMPIDGKLAAFCSANMEIKHWAQRTFVSYVRSVHLQANKDIFDVRAIPLRAFAESLGLTVTPNVRFVAKAIKQRQQKEERMEAAAGKKLHRNKGKPAGQVKSVGIASSGSESPSDDSDAERHSVASAPASSQRPATRPKLTRQDLSDCDDDESEESDGSDGHSDGDSDGDSDEVLTKVRGRQSHVESSGSESDGDDDESEESEESSDDDLLKSVKGTKLDEIFTKEAMVEAKRASREANKVKTKTKVQMARSILKKKIKSNTHTTFGDDGEVETAVSYRPPAELNEDSDLTHLEPVALGEKTTQATGGLDIMAATREMRGADRRDLLRHRERVKEMHKEQRRKLREEMRRDVTEDGDAGVQLGGGIPQESDDPSSAEEDSPAPAKKRRAPAIRKQPPAASAARGDDDFETGGSLRDDEALAMHLLSKR